MIFRTKGENIKFSSRTLTFASLCAASFIPQLASAYSVTIIDPIYTGAGNTSSAYGISPSGKVTGTSSVSIPPPFVGPGPNIKNTAFLWTPTVANGPTMSTFVNAGTLSSPYPATGYDAWIDHSASTGYSVNDSGQVAGISGFNPSAASNTRGFFWDGASNQPGPQTTKGYVFTNGLSGSLYRESTDSLAYYINSSGMIAGNAPYAKLPTDPDPYGTFMLSQGFVVPFGQESDTFRIGFPFWDGITAGPQSAAYAINDFGQVTGYSSGQANQIRAFVSNNGVYTDIGLPLGATGATGVEIDSRGDLVVRGYEPGGYSQYLWQPDVARGTTGSFYKIDGPANTYLYAHGIARNNSRALVVGHAVKNDTVPYTYAWKWGRSTGIEDLNVLYPTTNFVFRSAEGVNNLGQIVGYGDLTVGSSTVRRGFLINP